MKAKVTFEATGEKIECKLESVRKAYRYHGPQIGQFTDTNRTEFFVPAPTSARDFREMLDRYFS